MITIEVQYFDGCPHSDKMIKRVKEAITKLSKKIEYKEVLVNSPDKAAQYKFRGSPTVLINGIDLEGLPEPDSGNLACRYYKNGIPSTEDILKNIENSANQEG